MTRVNNPRFPHTCLILRAPDTEPMEDEPKVSDDPMVDEPMESEPVSDEPTDGEEETQEQEQEESPKTSDEKKKYTVIYEGICRGYNRDTTSDNGDVNTSYRMLALPLKQDEWTDETIPREGDRIELHRFGYTEYGQVIDRRPSNLGTHLLWKYVRN